VLLDTERTSADDLLVSPKHINRDFVSMRQRISILYTCSNLVACYSASISPHIHLNCSILSHQSTDTQTSDRSMYSFSCLDPISSAQSRPTDTISNQAINISLYYTAMKRADIQTPPNLFTITTQTYSPSSNFLTRDHDSDNHHDHNDSQILCFPFPLSVKAANIYRDYLLCLLTFLFFPFFFFSF
jgi:hypothetical protein